MSNIEFVTDSPDDVQFIGDNLDWDNLVPGLSLGDEADLNEMAERSDPDTNSDDFDVSTRVVLMGEIGRGDHLPEDKTICEDHNEVQKYYCKDEDKAICHDCIVLKKCPMKHDRITIIEAVRKKYEELEDFLKKSGGILKKYQDSVKQVTDIERELEIRSQAAKDALAGVEQEYIKLLKKTVRRFEDQIDNIKEERLKELNEKKTEFKSAMNDIEKANEDVTQIIQSPHKMDIISGYLSMSSTLKTLSKSQPDYVDRSLGYIKFEAAIPSIPTLGELSELVPRKPWKLIEQFSTGDFNELLGLALDQDDNIVVCSWGKGVKVFTRNGDVKSTIYDSPGTISVGVLLGKKYVTAPRGTKQIKICDSRGKKAITYPIKNVNNMPSIANSVTVDFNDMTIIGQVKNTISIHHPDGTLIFKFATEFEPYRLAATSSGEIVSSFYDAEFKRGTSVQTMDYLGGNVKVFQPPDEVKVWSPGFVCCKQGEIFVSNEGSGDPNGIYRFTYEGTYLDCVTTEVKNPTGIAMSNDGMELFVADRGDRHVKIFQRP